MVVNCYNTASDAADVNKSLTLVKTVNLEVKGTNNLMDAELTITNPASVTFNYVQIMDAPYNGRYYFVSPETTTFNGIVVLALHEDVLMSLKGQFLNEVGIIARQQNTGNLYLVDTKFPIEARKETYFKQFPSGFDTAFKYYLTSGG